MYVLRGHQKQTRFNGDVGYGTRITPGYHHEDDITTQQVNTLSSRRGQHQNGTLMVGRVVRHVPERPRARQGHVVFVPLCDIETVAELSVGTGSSPDGPAARPFHACNTLTASTATLRRASAHDHADLQSDVKRPPAEHAGETQRVRRTATASVAAAAREPDWKTRSIAGLALRASRDGLAAVEDDLGTRARPMWAEVDIDAITHKMPDPRASRQTIKLLGGQGECLRSRREVVGRHLETIGVEGLPRTSTMRIAIRQGGATLPILL